MSLPPLPPHPVTATHTMRGSGVGSVPPLPPAVAASAIIPLPPSLIYIPAPIAPVYAHPNFFTPPRSNSSLPLRSPASGSSTVAPSPLLVPVSNVPTPLRAASQPPRAPATPTAASATSSASGITTPLVTPNRNSPPTTAAGTTRTSPHSSPPAVRAVSISTPASSASAASSLPGFDSSPIAASSASSSSSAAAAASAAVAASSSTSTPLPPSASAVSSSGGSRASKRKAGAAAAGKQRAGSKSNSAAVIANERGFCDVCYLSEDGTSDSLVYCSSCRIGVHPACYGNPLVDSSLPTANWKCERCMWTPAGSPAVSCALCPDLRGAMKRTTDWRWAHMRCALWHPDVYFRSADPKAREPIDITGVKNWRWQQRCIYCSKSTPAATGAGSAESKSTAAGATAVSSSSSPAGACIQCSVSGCERTFHVTCGMEHGITADYKTNVTTAAAAGSGGGAKSGVDVIVIRCTKHARQLLRTDFAAQLSAASNYSKS